MKMLQSDIEYIIRKRNERLIPKVKRIKKVKAIKVEPQLVETLVVAPTPVLDEVTRALAIGSAGR